MVNRHPWSLNYIWLKLIATAIRTVISPLIFISTLTKERTVSGVTKTKFRVPSREKNRFVKINIYRPKHIPNTESLPVHINMHGSGFVLRMHGTDQGWCSYLSKRMGIVVIDADYSKAPEFPFPQGLQDVEDVILWCYSNPHRFNFDTRRITIGGHSAGGNLALAASYSLGPGYIKAATCLYPPTDFQIRSQPRQAPLSTFDSGVTLSRSTAKLCDACYLIKGSDRLNPKLSLVKAAETEEGMKRFPGRVFLATGDGDLLFNDGQAFVKKLQDSGHPSAVFMRISNEGHGWDKMTWGKPSSERKKFEAYDKIVETIRAGWED